MDVTARLEHLCPEMMRPYYDRIKGSDVAGRLARGTFWSLVGTVVSRGLAFGATVLVARMLGAKVFGELNMIRSTVGMFGTLAGFGLGTTTTRYVAKFRDTAPERVGRILAFSRLVAGLSGATLAVLLTGIAPWLARQTMGALHLAPLLRIGGLLLLFSALNGMENGALAGFEDFRGIATVNLWGGLANFPLMLGGVWAAGLAGALWALSLGMAINWFLAHVAVRGTRQRRQIPFGLRGCWAEREILWSFALPTMLSSLSSQPAVWLCNAMLVNRPNGYSQMGIFGAAIQFKSILLLAAGVLSQPLLALITNEDAPSSDRLGRVNILASWVVGTIPVLPLLSFPEIAEWLFGAAYAGEGFRLTVSISMIFTAITLYKQGLARCLVSEGLMWWGALSNAVWSVLLVAASWRLVGLGSLGLALSYLFAYAVDTIIFIPLYRSRGLVPMDTLISADALMIWVALSGMAVPSVLRLPMWVRVLTFITGLILIVLAFSRIGFGGRRKPVATET